MGRDELDKALLAAYAVQDAAQLIDLHQQAMAYVETAEEKRFHLTHAWVHALDNGDRLTIERLEALLQACGGL